MELLNTDYVDLFLVHSPFGEKLVETWDGILELQAEGHIKSVGVFENLAIHLRNFYQKIEIAEVCKGVHCVDLGESFQTHI